MVAETEAERPASFAHRFRLGQLLALVAGGPALVVTAAVVIGIVAITRQNSVRDKLLLHVEPANGASLRLLTAMINQETGIRGYELTGQKQFLEPYRFGVTQARTEEQDLRKDAVPGTATPLDASLRRIQAWESETAKPALRLGASESNHSRSQIDTSLKAKTQFDAIRHSLGVLQDKLTADVHTVKAQLGSSANTTEIAFSVIGFALIVSVLSVSLLLRRLVTRPINMLAGSARRVAGGDLTHSVTVVGPQDLELLSRDVDNMRSRLLSELTASQAMHTQLEEAATELQRSNTELEQFAYVASHDLQEPLRKVTSFCQLLQQRYAGQMDERADQYIGFAVDGAKRMQELINDLLAFSRVGRQSSLTPISLQELVTAAVADLDSAIQDSQAEISVGPLPTLAVESALIRTVFQNLLGNAIKFRSDDAPRIALEAERDGDQWRFSCTDNGIGIEPEYAERIFVIFQRLHTRETYAGTGIGLAMCRKIVEHHGGKMWLDQTYTGGTRMLFTLPAETPQTTGGVWNSERS